MCFDYYLHCVYVYNTQRGCLTSKLAFDILMDQIDRDRKGNW